MEKPEASVGHGQKETKGSKKKVPHMEMKDQGPPHTPDVSHNPPSFSSPLFASQTPQTSQPRQVIKSSSFGISFLSWIK